MNVDATQTESESLSLPPVAAVPALLKLHACFTPLWAFICTIVSSARVGFRQKIRAVAQRIRRFTLCIGQHGFRHIAFLSLFVAA